MGPSGRSSTTSSTWRPRCSTPRSSRAHVGERSASAADGRREHALRHRGSAAPTRHPTQYFEMFGNRAIFHEGWFARVIHVLPWSTTPLRPLAEDVWELYDTRTDFSLRNDLASASPIGCARCRRSSSARRFGTACSPSTTGASSASTPRWWGGPTSCGAAPASPCFRACTSRRTRSSTSRTTRSR